MWLSCLLLVLGLALVVGGAEFLVSGASGIARKAGISEFVIGLTIVGFGTSCPELVVSLTGAFAGNADIAVGNVIGSNIIRGKERITARGDTVLLAGDRAILVTKAYEDRHTFLTEKTVKPGGKRAGHAIREFDSKDLVLIILRGEKEIIPHGDTVLEAGDVLVILGNR